MKQLVVVALLLLLAGCSTLIEPPYESPYGYTGPCAPEMDEVRAAMGLPEEVNTYSSDGYYNVDWWYWSRGWERSFTWGSYVTGCDISTYTFDPIR